MKILHYINNLGGGGAERLLSFLLPLLKDNQHEIHLAYCNDEENINDFEKIIIDAGVIIHNFRVSTYHPVNSWKLIQLNKSHQFDIIHAHLFPTQYWLAFASYFLPSSTKLIKTEHNTENGRRKYSFLKPLEKIIYSRYERLIGITEEVKKNLVEWLGMSDKTVVIQNGVSLTEVRGALNNLDKSKYDFLKKENVNILMVARFAGEAKDQISLIQATQYLPSNYHIYFAGTGDLMNKAKEEVTRLKHTEQVHFLGMRTDVYALMNLVDLNVLSSNFEGLSGVALESMASSKPFIGSDVPGINNIVPNDQFLFPKKNPEKLAQKILKITTQKELSEKLVLEANLHTRQFDIINMSDAYEKLYYSVVKKK